MTHYRSTIWAVTRSKEPLDPDADWWEPRGLVGRGDTAEEALDLAATGIAEGLSWGYIEKGAKYWLHEVDVDVVTKRPYAEGQKTEVVSKTFTDLSVALVDFTWLKDFEKSVPSRKWLPPGTKRTGVKDPWPPRLWGYGRKSVMTNVGVRKVKINPSRPW